MSRPRPLAKILSEFDLPPELRRLHPMCRRCGWAMGGIDSWNGRACKCGNTAAPFPDEDADSNVAGKRPTR